VLASAATAGPEVTGEAIEVEVVVGVVAESAEEKETGGEATSGLLIISDSLW